VEKVVQVASSEERTTIMAVFDAVVGAKEMESLDNEMAISF
jgi:hypothetical protein